MEKIVHLRTLFEQKKLSIEDTDAIKEFSQKFIVEEKPVKSYLKHLSSLETVKNIRQEQREGARQERHARDVSDYKPLLDLRREGLAKISIYQNTFPSPPLHK